MRYGLQRVVGAAGVLLVVSFLIYWLGTFIPGDAATVIVGSEGATAEQYRDLRHRLGLDDPVPVLVRCPQLGPRHRLGRCRRLASFRNVALCCHLISAPSWRHPTHHAHTVRPWLPDRQHARDTA